MKNKIQPNLLTLYQLSKALGLLSRSSETRLTTSESDSTSPLRLASSSLSFTSEFSAQKQTRISHLFKPQAIRNKQNYFKHRQYFMGS